MRWYGQALELLGRAPHPDDHQRAQLLVGLGEAQRQSGIAAHRETLLAAAHLSDQIDDIDLLVRAVLANNRGYNSAIGVTDHERIAAIDRALERIGSTPTAARAQLLALAATERVYLDDLDERVARAPTRPSRLPGPAATAPPSLGHSSVRTIRSPTHRRSRGASPQWTKRA